MATTVDGSTPTVDDVATAATAEDAVKKAVRAAAGLGVPGIFHPGLDEAGMSVIWIAMVTAIAQRRGISISRTTATKLVGTALAGVAAYSAGSKILTWGLLLILHVMPIAIVPAAVGLNVALNALFTYKLGTTCIRRLSDPELSTREIVDIGRQIAMVPTLTEIGEIKRMLTS
jgi:hypothetical protein